MLNHSKTWKAEYAKSSRSSCKACQRWIKMETLRLGKTVHATRFDGVITRWNHASCILKKGSRIKSTDDVEGFELLRWDDQQKIRKYVDDAAAKASAPIVLKCGVEVSQTSLATCRCCKQKITKGEVRISTKPENQKSKVVVWHHSNCYMDMSPTLPVQKFSGWDNISESDRETLLSLVDKNSTVSRGTKIKQEEPLQESEWKGGVKRKRSGENKPKSEVDRTVGVSSTKETASRSSVKNFESELEIQSKSLWSLKDDIKTHVSLSELREMLQVNDQDTSGSELDLRQNCADGMLFGALAKCSFCSGFLSYSSGMYRCCGYISEWSKCSYSTTEPQRIKGKWKIPDNTSNEYLLKWFKSQKVEKLEKVYPQAVESPKTEHVRNLKVAIVGLSNESVDEWKNKIVKLGGKFHSTINKVTSCLVVFGALSDHAEDIRNARWRNVPVVREAYLADCITTQRKLPFALYRVKPMEERRIRSKVQKKLPFDSCKVESMESTGFLSTVMVKGQSAVNWFSDLQYWGHILEDGKSIYNTTLNMSDLSTGINSYYILQIIEDDKSSDCVVFRKWGRVGSEEIGGTKSEDMCKSNAIHEFKRLFLKKTGNSWESWEKKKNFQKQPGRYFPLDIDYGVRLEPKKKKQRTFTSKLAPQLVKLMKMLFNVETYRAAMLELKVDLSKMPLGKLSKSNIQKGFEALTQIQNLFSSTDYSPSVKETLIVDASNMFFTVIPSIHPHVIKDEDDLKSKEKMLEALQDIEIASKLVGFDADNHESIDEKYKKLHCHITPLPRDSEDFKLIEKYIKTTHAPTHKDWALELEEVFSIEREGELAKYAPYRAELKNKMLLWHGSRLTNFVGILSQGLRIAPPEAPKNGYMFGKGIYFADLVSKSALDCCTNPTNPVGLILLSEVALGNVYELTNSEYMDEPPEGKHSTKGLGKRVPLMSEHVKWRDDVVVPCGKPVASRVKDTELMYNEYIVYDQSQVKMEYLLKVRFHHKRKRM